MGGNGRKEKIIRSAQESFSEKGFTRCSLAEIAKKAGVTDPIIYHYFKNKEELLFSALSEKLIDVTRELELHLEGIADPVSRLRKMIWYHLYVNDLSPNKIRILKNLLLECRANQNFYSSAAFKKLRHYTKHMIEILKLGVDKHVFSSDLNLILVRDLIFGLLDQEGLSCFASHEIDRSLPDFEHIMDLILAMIMTKGISGGSFPCDEEDKGSRIIQAAEELFADKGFDATTLSEIALRAKVAEGTIYIYFDNKKDLLFSITKKRLTQYQKSMATLFDVTDVSRNFFQIIRFQFTTFLSNRDFLKVFLFHNILNREFYASDAYKIFVDYVAVLERVVEEGIKTGVFRKNINVRVFKNLFSGALTHMTARWTILGETRPSDILQEIETAAGLLYRALVSDGNSNSESR
ncbi:transcriptional regulator, TetR family [delta proteobacterium NaphS2]|nr:transcriptional regulator, TetR family [delta proteobacterium NaphS2]